MIVYLASFAATRQAFRRRMIVYYFYQFTRGVTMWNITKKAKEAFLKHNLLPIHESDSDWEISLREAAEEGEDLAARLAEELEEVKAELLPVLPSRFLPYVENGTLNQPSLPKSVREDYLQWMREGDREFEQVLDAAQEQTKQAAALLSPAVHEVFEESLHDAVIDRIEREPDTLHLYINTDSGFSAKSYIHLTLQQITEGDTDELQEGQWLIYYELQKTAAGFAFRVLFEGPDAQWTIHMKDMTARYFYRPAIYTRLSDEGKLEDMPLGEYTAELEPGKRYWLAAPDVLSEISRLGEIILLEDGKLEIEKNKAVITTSNGRFTYTSDEFNPISAIYTDTYEDPYAHLNEPVPSEELEAAVFSGIPEQQVRAWNTMYTNPEDHAENINRILKNMEITEENEMMAAVYAAHFYKAGILTEENIKKYGGLFE
ncbi:DUF4085 domain-containing protein [Bacillus infantis]|uniref:DUF4085 family protein n=1 Tax=Bacillus infantis TaxID=324767 RepID=UPI001CD7A7C9|nr:DUF4085 family protein [Bacillus infantis]MCA1041521.1 DUF4085 domain-containing protein [Bacillus infantis]